MTERLTIPIRNLDLITLKLSDIFPLNPFWEYLEEVDGPYPKEPFSNDYAVGFFTGQFKSKVSLRYLQKCCYGPPGIEYDFNIPTADIISTDLLLRYQNQEKDGIDHTVIMESLGDEIIGGGRLEWPFITSMKPMLDIEEIGPGDLVILQLPSSINYCVSIDGNDYATGFFAGFNDEKIYLSSFLNQTIEGSGNYRDEKRLGNDENLLSFPTEDVSEYMAIRKFIHRPV